MMKMMMMMMKRIVYISQKTHLISNKKTNRLMTYRERIAVYFENCMKEMNAFCGKNAQLLNVLAGGTYSNHYTLNAKAETITT
jgi:hypothetical protein